MASQYFNPRSLTFWVGLFSSLLALYMGAYQEGFLTGGWADAGAVITRVGGGSPALLMSVGLGLIGIRRKLEEMTSR